MITSLANSWTYHAIESRSLRIGGGFFVALNDAEMRSDEMEESKVIELYAKYDNCRQVAAELNVSDNTIRRVLIKNGISRTGRNRVMTHA